MSESLRLARAACATLCAASLFLFPLPARGQDASGRYAGRSLSEALRLLQTHGLRIVFSSEIVTAGMRVTSEPRAKATRRMLDELLEPHGLTAETGPGGVVQIVRAKRPASPAAPPSGPPRLPKPAPPAAGSPRPISGEAGSYKEQVTVRPPWRGRQGEDPGPEARLSATELEPLRGVLTDDPMRAVQALPRVGVGDDFRSEISVRGSPYRYAGVVVDGVATPWLLHSAYSRGDTPSVAMLSGDVIEEATLQTGTYPHRDGDRLGAQLGLVLREGTRAGAGFGGSVSGTHAAFLAEGPIGRGQRGSWLFNIRQSYRDWPIGQRDASTGSVFGFRDAQGKLVFDVRPTQQVSFTFLSGLSALDQVDEPPRGLGDGANSTAVLNLAWRSTLGPRTIITQRTYLVAHQFLDKTQAGSRADRGSDRDLSYRVDLTRSVFGGVLELGGQTQRVRGSRRFPVDGGTLGGDSAVQDPRDSFDGSSWLGSGYVHLTWAPAPHLTLAHGLRVSDSTLVRRRTIGPWLLAGWSFREGWTLNGSAGVSHQLPDVQHVLGASGSRDLRPEQAANVDLGIEQRLAGSVRWQAVVYQRDERDVLRPPDTQPRFVRDVLTEPSVTSRYENALSGSSRGVELLLERRHAERLSGWIAYSFGKTRYTDAARHETFWGDFDQRHSLNMFARYRLSTSTDLAVTFRGGSNFPVPGYLTNGDGGRLVAGSERNMVRLPRYERLDVRASRTFNQRDRRLTLFLEVLNVFNRTNLGLANGRVSPDTGEATGFTRSLYPRLVSAGIRVRF